MSRAFRLGVGLALLAMLSGAGRAMAAVEVEARLSAGKIEAGGVVSLFVIVRNPSGGVADPQFSLPSGLELLGNSGAQEFPPVHGRSTNQITFRFEVGATVPGRYAVGPIRVSVGGRPFRSAELSLVVTTSAPAPAVASPRGRGRTDRIASLVVTLEPRDPVVGQLCRLRVRLISRVTMSEDSDTSPPATPGFWSESWGEATNSEATEGGRKVFYTEVALRLYPLAAGPAVVSSGYATVTPLASGLIDPFSGGVSSRVQIQSESLRVAVRPLPSDPPAGFDGGVGQFELAWSADRSHTTQDQAITARLDVRGVGNLPLLRAPAFAPNEFEVFASSVEDSFPRAGDVGVGRRAFVWTLLPRRAGALHVSAPTLAWYDPLAMRYLRSTPAALALDVLSPSGAAGGEDADGWPGVLRSHPSRPGGRAAWPPLAWLGGMLVALGVAAWRRSLAPDPGTAERARQREWLRAIGLAHGPDFWRAADETAEWLRVRGDPVLNLRDAIAAARFGGRVDQEADVRRRLVERLGAAMPGPPARWPWHLAAVLAAACGLALAVWSGPRTGPVSLADRAAAADTRARAGRPAQAEAEWARLWDETGGDAPLAARLAWGALARQDVSAATVWAMRGERREARDPALALITARVRDAGGLVGAPGRALPLRSLEWAILAFALAVAAGLLTPRRTLALTLFAASFVAGVWWTGESAWRATQKLAVVRNTIALPPGGVLLDVGQVVRVLGRAAGEADVRAASDLVGTLPTSALWFLE